MTPAQFQQIENLWRKIAVIEEYLKKWGNTYGDEEKHRAARAEFITEIDRITKRGKRK